MLSNGNRLLNLFTKPLCALLEKEKMKCFASTTKRITRDNCSA
jgi:hypothetical protein